MKVIKRNGNQVEFDATKICKAVKRAFDEVNAVSDDTKYSNLIADIVNDVHAADEESEDSLSVEDIQDIVETELIDYQYADVARAYIKYRYDHELKRTHRLDSTIEGIVANTDEYFKKENSNKNSQLLTTGRDYLAGAISQDMIWRTLFNKKLEKAHKEGYIHIHDTDYRIQPMTNCGLANIADILNNGTVMSGIKITKPNSLLVAMNLTLQALCQITSNQYGGVSINLADLAPFVRSSYNRYLKFYKESGLSEEQAESLADKATKKEIKDAVQLCNYQSETLVGQHGQSAFWSLFIYLNGEKEYRQELIDLTLEFFRQRVEGIPNADGVKITQAFPKILYVLDSNNYKEGTPYWYVTQAAIDCSSKRLTPDYISEKKMLELKGDVFACMGKRKL